MVASSGTTIVFGNELQRIETQQSQSADRLYYAPPLLTDPVTGQTIPCAVQVQETDTPVGCNVIGGRTQTIIYNSNITEFSFVFEHACGDNVQATRVPTA